METKTTALTLIATTNPS